MACARLATQITYTCEDLKKSMVNAGASWKPHLGQKALRGRFPSLAPAGILPTPDFCTLEARRGKRCACFAQAALPRSRTFRERADTESARHVLPARHSDAIPGLHDRRVVSPKFLLSLLTQSQTWQGFPRHSEQLICFAVRCCFRQLQNDKRKQNRRTERETT